MRTLAIRLQQMNKKSKTNYKLQLCNIETSKREVLKWYNTSKKSKKMHKIEKLIQSRNYTYIYNRIKKRVKYELKFHDIDAIIRLQVFKLFYSKSNKNTHQINKNTYP